MDYIYKNRFIWNIDKAEKNREKHEGISFENAADAFDNFFNIEEFDDENSLVEERFNKTVFANELARYITVSYTIRGDLIRIFSAREAETEEKEAYEEFFRACFGAR
jgi:uncharacterized DUF497 family protein